MVVAIVSMKQVPDAPIHLANERAGVLSTCYSFPFSKIHPPPLYSLKLRDQHNLGLLMVLLH